jgi:ribosome-binding protein aMBF1 (putative translation factor)
MYKAVMIIIAFIGIVLQADSAYPFERSEEKKDVIINGSFLMEVRSESNRPFAETRLGKSEVRKKDSELRSEKVNTNYELLITNYEEDTGMSNNQLSIKKSVWQW